MPGFMDIKTGGLALKGLIASFAMVFIGGGFTIYYQLTGTGPAASARDVSLKCTNPDCDYTATISAKEHFSMGKEQYEDLKINDPARAESITKSFTMGPGGMGPGMMMNLTPEELEEQAIRSWGSPQLNLPFTCPKCGQDTVYKAYKCDECGEIFFPDYQQQYADTCPACGHSAAKAAREARRLRKQEERKKKLERKKRRRKK